MTGKQLPEGVLLCLRKLLKIHESPSVIKSETSRETLRRNEEAFAQEVDAGESDLAYADPPVPPVLAAEGAAQGDLQ